MAVQIDQNKIIQERIEYYSRKRTLLENKLTSANELRIFYEENEPSYAKEKAQQKLEVTNLRLLEMEVENEIKSAQYHIDDYLLRQQETEGYLEAIASIKKNFGHLRKEAETIIKSDKASPPFKDMLKGILSIFAHESFEQQPEDIKNKTYYRLYAEVSRFNNLQKK